MKIQKHFDKKANIETWCARFQLGGKEFYPQAQTRRELLQIIDEIRARHHRRKFDLPVSAPAPALAELFARRIRQIQNKREITLAERVFNLFLSLVEPDFKIKNLRRAHLQKYIDRREREVQGQTANREMTCIASALHNAASLFPELDDWIAPRIPKSKNIVGRRERLITKEEKRKTVELFVSAEKSARNGFAGFSPHAARSYF